MPSRVRQQHEELQSAMDRVTAAVSGWPDVDMGNFLRARMKFAKTVKTYLGEEQNYLNRQALAPLHAEAIADLQTLLSDYSALVTRWTPELIQADWPGYIDTLRTFGRRLTARLAWEDEEVLPPVHGRLAAA